MAEIAYVALGGNLGDRAAYLASARSALTLVRGVDLVAASRVEETVPLGSSVQGAYLNQMVAVATTLSPESLLDRLQQIERGLGRVRGRRWGARTIDLDIVRFGETRLSTARLELPHPGLADRDFWRQEVEELNGLLREVRRGLPSVILSERSESKDLHLASSAFLCSSAPSAVNGEYCLRGLHCGAAR
ncbi:MAG: 2-amino-4-hydroxy-6-hydroxymethyldihydropteridine diphosphokinase [bacterium]